MRVVGYLHGRGRRRAERDRELLARLSGSDCENPLLAECEDCGRGERWPCSCHRETRCRPCAARYRRRLVRVAESGCGRPTGYLYFLTLTAPGEHRHVNTRTGEWCPCTPDGGVDLAAWNASHSARWNHFRTVLRQGVPELVFIRGVEVQQRGALHDHAIVHSPVPLDVEELRALAMRAGFGHSIDLAPIEPGSRKAAYYISKYVTKACDSRESVPWVAETVDELTGEIRVRPVTARYRTWSSSRQWGLTMAAVRSICAAQARARAERLRQESVALVAAQLDAQVLDDTTDP